MSAEVKSHNELIASFMGLESRVEYGDLWIHFTPELQQDYWRQPKYHESWDWIIPVAQKIKHLTYKDLKSQELPTFQQAVARWHAVQNEISNLKIEAAHYCIVHWIKWYNSQPK